MPSLRKGGLLRGIRKEEMKKVRVASGSPSKKTKIAERFFVVRAPAIRQEDSKSLLCGIVNATRKAGIDSSVVFGSGTTKKVYAYSVLPSDPSKIVREAEDGTRTVGRVHNGQFRAIKSPSPGQ